jgi:hypothetical protein
MGRSGRAPRFGNATPAVDLPPTSAALTTYDPSHQRRYGKGNGHMAMKDLVAMKDLATAKAVEGTELQRRYGQIGISAVAAAARYQGEAKNPAYAPVQTRWWEYYPEDAAA